MSFLIIVYHTLSYLTSNSDPEMRMMMCVAPIYAANICIDFKDQTFIFFSIAIGMLMRYLVDPFYNSNYNRVLL